MRFAHPKLGHPPSWTLAAAAAIALIGCGQGEQPAEPSTGSTKAPAAGSPPAPSQGKSPAPIQGSLVAEAANAPGDGYLLVPPRKDEIQFEPAVEKAAPSATFLEAAAPKMTPPAVANLPGDDELMGKPLVIGSKVVPFEEIKKQVCLDSLGVAEIEHMKMRIFIKEEQERRRKEGASEEEVSLGAGEMDGVIKNLESEIKTEFPEGNVAVDDVLVGLGSANPRERLRMQKLFEKLFVPEDPDKFPPLTVEAIMSNEGGDSMLDSCRQRYAAMKADPNPAPKTQEDRFFDSIIIEQVVTHLREKAVVQPDASPSMICRVNGVEIKTDDVWNAIKPLVTTMEVRAAKQWITNTTLLREALIKAGAWLSDEEADAAYHAHSDPYKDSIFSMERIALMLKRFPSVERYDEYRHIYESYKRMIASELTKENVDKLAEQRTNRVVGQVTADVDVILCSAFDFKTQRWKVNGWKDAENRMRDVLRLLVEEQRPWDELVEKYSEFYQPPVAVSERGQVDPDRPQKGRFRNLQRNNMLTELGESVYSCFLNGSSITDFVYFDQKVGSFGDPMRGPMGWYLPRLLKRSKPPERLPMAPERLQEVKEEDYVQWSMDRFVQDLIAKNAVYGLELPDQDPK